jgi:hypothetical protein
MSYSLSENWLGSWSARGTTRIWVCEELSLSVRVPKGSLPLVVCAIAGARQPKGDQWRYKHVMPVQ